MPYLFVWYKPVEALYSIILTAHKELWHIAFPVDKGPIDRLRVCAQLVFRKRNILTLFEMGKCLLTMVTGTNCRHIFYILIQGKKLIWNGFLWLCNIKCTCPLQLLCYRYKFICNSHRCSELCLKKCRRIHGNMTLCMRQIWDRIWSLQQLALQFQSNLIGQEWWADQKNKT